MLFRCNNLLKSAFALLLAFLFLTPGFGETVTRVSWDPPNAQHNKFILEFDAVPRYNVVDNLASSNYFYIDFYGLQQSYKRRLLEIENDPFLKYVDALSYADSGVLRLVFYAKQPNTKFEIQSKSSPPSIIIYTLKQGSSAPNTGVTVADSSTSISITTAAADVPVTTAGISTQIGFEIPKIPEPDAKIARQHSRGKKYIMIDPGHGGANGGATSDVAIGGRKVQEKELTIKFAYELKKLIDSHPDLVGLMTRVDDSNVGLRERVKIAEDNRGDAGNLFISLHLNDAPQNPNARGMEVFFLNEKGTVDAAVRQIEEKENRDVGMSDDSSGQSILSTMMTEMKKQKLQDWQYESYIFCRRLEQSMLTYPYFAKYNRGVKNANFVVLKNFEMPAVLLEIGFISNTQELKSLVDPAFQNMTAKLIYNAINAYFAENDPTFKPRYVSTVGAGE